MVIWRIPSRIIYILYSVTIGPPHPTRSQIYTKKLTFERFVVQTDQLQFVILT